MLSLVRIIAATAGLLTVPALAGAQNTFSVLHSFSDPGVLNPNAPLIQATDGNFYGTTLQGGANDAGNVFKMTPGGVVTILHTFTNRADGGFPSAGLIQVNGDLYGATTSGGLMNGQQLAGGTIFKITLGGFYTVRTDERQQRRRLSAPDTGNDGLLTVRR
jgi:uncharacterized repeat protein (TIGR03803 family)